MKRTVEQFYCDLCSCEVSVGELRTEVPVFVRHTCDDTEGCPCAPYYTQEKFDFCQNCFDRVVSLDVGFRNTDLKIRKREE